MADAFIGVDEPVTIDKRLDTEQLTVGAETVMRERVEISGAAATEIARVLNAAPAGTEMALVTRPIPSGTQNVADGGGALTVDALDLDIRNLDPATDKVAVRLRDAADAGYIEPLTDTQLRASNVNVAVNAALPAGTNNIGDVDVVSLPALPAGNNNIGDVDVATLPALATGANVIGQVGLEPRTSGGTSIHRTISAGSTNATNVKATAGQLYGLLISNTNAAVRYLKLYNLSGAPTVGTSTPVITIALPGNASGATGMIEFTNGIAFSTGIAFALTTGVADADTGAVAANEIVVHLFYK